MAEKQKAEYSQIEAGHEFPASSFQMDDSAVAIYLRAVGETGTFYQDSRLVPPTAIAAFAMAALSEKLSLPPGTIHVSQDLEFMDTISTSDTLTCHARVSKKQERGKLHLLTVDLNVHNQQKKAVLAGKTSFILPEQG